MYDYDILKESNISLKKDLEMTKERLNELMKLNKTNQVMKSNHFPTTPISI